MEKSCSQKRQVSDDSSSNDFMVRHSAELALSSPTSHTENQMTTKNTEPVSKSRKGFASMDRDRQREIASMGGKAVKAHKRSFSQNRQLAAEAGRKGGKSVPGVKRSFSTNRLLATEAGRKGGQAVPDEKRSFSQDRELAAAAGRKGGENSHGGGGTDVEGGVS